MQLITKTGARIAGALLVALCLAGCNSEDVNNLKQDTRKLGQDVGPILTNATLATKVTTHLSLHKGVDMSGLHIEAKGSTVTVSGHVHDQNAHHVVITVVKETTGVDNVIDQLREER